MRLMQRLAGLSAMVGEALHKPGDRQATLDCGCERWREG